MNDKATNDSAWFETREQAKFWPENPVADAIDIETIATVLGWTPRFGGHAKFFYTVAQHSIHVAELVQEPHLKLPALLHDAHEAYTGFGDVLRPAKQLAPIVAELEAKIDRAIAERFGFSPSLFSDPRIKHADNMLLATERRDVKGNSGHYWGDLPDPIPASQVRIGSMSDPAGMFLAMAERYRQLGGWPAFERETDKAEVA